MKSITLRFIQTVWRILAIVLLMFSSNTSTYGGENPDAWAPVHPSLLEETARSLSPVSFLVILKEQPQPDLILAQRRDRTTDSAQKRAILYTYLTDFAQRSQAPLWQWLDAQGVDYRPFYIINAIEVMGDAALITALRQRPEVARLAANPRVALPEPERDTEIIPRGSQAVDTPYGILYTKAPTVWEQGYRGQGVVVASQDTGVDWTHPSLLSKYRGWDSTTMTATHEYNWFDAWGTAGRSGCAPDPQVPCDDNGHGTHTVGTILGSDDNDPVNPIVGMAPDAEWIGCRNMNRGDGTPASYAACFQFFLAPYPQNGNPFTDGDPTKTPDLINNSWYCPPSEGCDLESLRQVVQTVRDAGQLIVASAGNHGPGCATIRYPISAYAEVFSVGAHGSSGAIASFSSRGPVVVDGSGQLKPEITAPGVSVLSSRVGGGYMSLSGTSMASPHVAGAVALMWSAASHLKGQLDETEQILVKSATPVLDTSIIHWFYDNEDRLICVSGSKSPNYTYGYGLLDAAAAVDMALHPASLHLTISASLTPSVTVQAILTDKLTGFTYT
ncbi:MAG: S8 family serine peptidase, partial [Caldilineaceae bacterium]|nr:S8 family serine peptidase [Caldilineaceae bacterium]